MLFDYDYFNFILSELVGRIASDQLIIEDALGPSDIKATDFTVSGIKGRKYVGTFDSKIKLKAEVIVIPLREKIMIFGTSDSAKYGAILEGILAGTKLVP